ncbi:CAP domain-containing protein [Thermodesulfobacteriota bacterium]
MNYFKNKAAVAGVLVVGALAGAVAGALPAEAGLHCCAGFAPAVGEPPDAGAAGFADSDDAAACVQKIAEAGFVAGAAASCDPNAEEQDIADLAGRHPGQGRSTMTCNAILAQVARKRAQDMGERDYFSHTNPDGYGPNYLVTQAGYVLPDFYSTARDANNIESIASGYEQADDAWDAWLGSPLHRQHVLGEASFYADQIEYGIGYAYVPGSTYKHYWVFLSAQPGSGSGSTTTSTISPDGEDGGGAVDCLIDAYITMLEQAGGCDATACFLDAFLTFLIDIIGCVD